MVAAMVMSWAGRGFAQIAWDGGDPAAPNADGNWSNNANWDTGALPTTTDLAIIPSVTDGSTRTVTQDIAAGTTANAIQLIQSSATGVNQLSLSGNLTLSAPSRENATADGLSSAFRVSLSGGATVDQVILDLNGFTIDTVTNGAGITGGMNLAGTVNFNAAGSSMIHSVGGHTVMNVFGKLVATSDGRIGRDNGTASTATDGSINFLAGSSLNISAGVFSVEMAGRRAQNRVLNLNNSGSITIATGATLAEVWTAGANSTHAASVTLTNQPAGVIVQGGTVSLRVHYDAVTAFTPPPINVNNNGVWVVSGTNAAIRRLTTSQDPSYVTVPAYTIGTTGTLKGSGANDILEFNEQVAFANRMTIINNGIIAPGDGTGGPGLSSVGTLTLRDINVTMGNGGSLNMDADDNLDGDYDHLSFQLGATDPAGAGTFDMSTAGDTLSLFTLDSFTPGSAFNVSLVTAGSVIGQFDNVTLDSVAFNANQLVVTEGTYTLSYTATSVDFGFTPVPEPSTYLLASIAGLALVAFARSGRSA